MTWNVYIPFNHCFYILEGFLLQFWLLTVFTRQTKWQWPSTLTSKPDYTRSDDVITATEPQPHRLTDLTFADEYVSFMSPFKFSIFEKLLFAVSLEPKSHTYTMVLVLVYDIF